MIAFMDSTATVEIYVRVRGATQVTRPLYVPRGVTMTFINDLPLQNALKKAPTWPHHPPVVQRSVRLPARAQWAELVNRQRRRKHITQPMQRRQSWRRFT